ncbi:multicopper oxidase family protein [Arthrobacter sp. PsM3]|uniref:multicopper oxidase family protein n=1 Tax=Arthrobacter sp. PsM3 TaxID=3030531 RepID=UPI00263BDFFC|nr:multicopper oxidase [Arthrobacter sp. PsM3]MDN4645923.1 multicopper oxidase [Arthrobacter sp. PsM3]
MEISRRTLFEAGAAAGAGLILAPVITSTASAAVPAGVTPFTEQLPTLAELGVIDATGGGSATIEMVNATHQFHSAMTATPTFAYRGGTVSQNYLGPVIVAKQGVPFDLTVVNSLGAHPLASAIDYGVDGAVAADATAPRASVHLHGGNTSPGNDGDPTDTFANGASKTYHYGNTQEAAGLWYHDHALGITRLNVFAGLAGGYVVRNGDDPGDGTTGLPPAPFEQPLVIQDRMFNSDGTFFYPANANPGTTGRPWAPEFFGDVATVNGKAWPNLNVDRGKYRFRVYNGSNARFYNLSLKSAGPANRFFQIGSDGGLLNAPVPLNTLLLGPGERADVVIDFAGLKPGAKVLLTNNARVPFPGGPRAVKRGGSPLPQIMQFTVTSATGWTAPLPATLRAAPITPLATTARPVTAVRTMTLVENLNALGSPLMVLLNNRNFDVAGATTTVGTNTLEQWELVNTTVDAHPIHLHFTQFQVLNRQKFDSARYLAANYGPQPLAPNTGSFPPPAAAFLQGAPQAPPANERGWKDTVVAMPGEVTRIVVPFGANAGGSVTAFQASFTGRYVWHCHILEHEDNDMMQRYVITA